MDPRWMEHAWACFGVREYSGSRSNAAVVQMYRDAGHASVKDDAVPWCAAFVGACLARADIKSTRSLRARSYLEWGHAQDAASYGAIAVLSRGQNPALGHVGFVVGVTKTHVFLLGGNQSNAVTVGKYNRSRVLGFRSLTNEVPSHSAPVEVERSAASDAFSVGLAHVLQMEGGFSDDPHDPGGPTNRGVTLATWARHLSVRLNGASRTRLIKSLKAIPDTDLQTIYRVRYWTPSRAEEMPRGFDLAHFDASVNHGLTGAAKLLQRTVGVVEDGEIGPITLGAVWSTDVADLIARHTDERAERYRRLPHFWRFGRGWLRRTHATERAALARMASSERAKKQNQAPPAKTVSTQSAPMTPQEREMSQSESSQQTKHWTKSLTLWGAFVTTLATVLPIVGPFFGLNVTADMVTQLGEQGLKVLQAIATFAGLAMTVTGRLRATSRLSH